jgi:hypothetical protein
VTPLVLYEIANDVVDVLPQDFPIREDTVDCLSDAASLAGSKSGLAATDANVGASVLAPF